MPRLARAPLKHQRGAMVSDWPMWGRADDARPAMRALRAAGHAFALATLYRVDGGGPRPPGSQMVIGPDVLSGFLSGGCVEGDVTGHAHEVIASGRPQRLRYGEASPWRDIRLPCGGGIDILVERVDPAAAALARLLDLADARRPAVWITDGAQARCEAASAPDGAPLTLSAAPFELSRLHRPPLRLVVVGADPSALAIAGLAVEVGLETTLVSDGGPEAPPPIRGLSYDRARAASALRAAALDPWTAVAVATHDLEADEAALEVALRSPAGYVGALGARRRLPERLARLAARGVGPADLARLRAPIGLANFGKAPWQIALSVIGEITQTLAREGAPTDDERA